MLSRKLSSARLATDRHDLADAGVDLTDGLLRFNHVCAPITQPRDDDERSLQNEG
jgi:hypothetical protein